MTTKCTHCGAPVDVSERRCRYCGHGTELAVREAERRGALIAEADFRGPTVAGWTFDRTASDGERLECRPGARPSLRVTLPASKSAVILWLGSAYDDIDLRLAVGFAQTVSSDANVSFRFRTGPKDQGGYSARLWSDGAWGFAWLEGNQHKDYLGKGGKPVQGWLAPPGINLLRVVANGDRLRMFIGETLACSLRDDHYKQGTVCVRVAAGDAELDLTITELALREPG
jgi:hypothetical protein